MAPLRLGDTLIRAGDIFFSRSHTWLGRAIRRLTTGAGEALSQVNHVGIFLNSTTLELAISTEALARVRTGRFWSFYHDARIEVAVWRDMTLTPEEQRLVVEEALHYRRHLYGFLKLPLHALDWALARAAGRRDAYVFRRLGFIRRYPICSVQIARAYSKANRNFGVAAGGAQPDDAWDFVNTHLNKWRCIVPLQRI